MIYESEINPNGERYECWKNDIGKCHREDGPSYIYYYKNGSIKEEGWSISGKYHRTNSPAVIEYNEDGNIKKELYFINGKRHKTDGPAIMHYNNDRSVKHKEYWWYGHNITILINKLFGCIPFGCTPDQLNKEQVVLLKLSLPEECFKYDI